jgi:bifunctional polynucleotide phosphatase/kinase
MEKSFFVGDAAGRKGDHSDTDRKWAINAGLRFHVPEELFK